MNGQMADISFSLCLCVLLTGARDPDKGTDKGDEPQLHRVQISPDKSTPLDKGEEKEACFAH